MPPLFFNLICNYRDDKECFIAMEVVIVISYHMS